MKGNGRRNTKPEVALRSFLHRHGFRFRKDLCLVVSGRRVRPDIAFTKARVAIFVDGCFWHFCPEHGHLPRANVVYWKKKLNNNLERDDLDVKALTEQGWTVLRIWEHMTVEEAHQAIEHAIRLREEARDK